MNIPDNYDLWEAQDIEKERLRARLPKCDRCGKSIQDDFCYEINEEIICEVCTDRHFRKHVVDYIEQD